MSARFHQSLAHGVLHSSVYPYPSPGGVRYSSVHLDANDCRWSIQDPDYSVWLPRCITRKDDGMIDTISVAFAHHYH